MAVLTCMKGTANRKEFWANMKTLIATCCICIALTQQCLGDQTLFTCADDIGYIYVAEGGQNKPGWEQKTSPNVTKLIRMEDAVKAGGFFDIQGTTKSGVISWLKEASCHIDDISKSMSLDMAFLVKCGFATGSFAHVSTYLFYTRSGVPRLLETYLSLEPAYTGAGMSVSKPCKTGD